MQLAGGHFVSFVMHICGAINLKTSASILREDIVNSVFYHFLVANLMTSSLT